MPTIVIILLAFLAVTIFIGFIATIADFILTVIGWCIVIGLIIAGVICVGSGAPLGWVLIIVGACCLFGSGGK